MATSSLRRLLMTAGLLLSTVGAGPALAAEGDGVPQGPTGVPAAPTGVTATVYSPTQILVTWNDTSNNETGFLVTDGTVNRSAGANYTWYMWGGLAPGTQKCFHVLSRNASGYSPWVGSANSCATIPAVPAAPTGVTATAISASVIRVTWTDNSDNETGFVVSDGTVSQPAGVNYTWFDWGGLAPGTYKCFFVKSVNGPESSPWAGDAPASCATIPTVPVAPTGVTATAISTSEIRVTWTDNSSNETGFRVSDGAGAATVGPNTTSFTMGGLTYGTYKCFRVESFNVAGFSPSTPWACAAIRGAKGDD